jgi:acyl carrier protein
MSVATGLIASESLRDDIVRERVFGLIREVLERRSLSRTILDEDDLREAGLNSLDMVNLMLAVEAEFDLKIPDSDMTLRNFRTVSSIGALVISLLRSSNGAGKADPGDLNDGFTGN